MAAAYPSDDDDDDSASLVERVNTLTDDDDSVHYDDSAPMFPLRIFHETSNEDSGVRIRGRQRGRSRGGRGNGRGENKLRSTSASNDSPEGHQRGRGQGFGNRRGHSEGQRRGGRGNRHRSNSRNRPASGFENDKAKTQTQMTEENNHGQSDRFRGRPRAQKVHSADRFRMRNTTGETGETQEQNAAADRKMAGGPRFTFNKLKFLSRKDDADSLLQEIAHSKSGFDDVLKDDIKPDWLYYILKILSTVTRSSQHNSLMTVLIKVDGSFMNKLNGILGEISLQAIEYQRLWGNAKTLKDICMMIMEILRSLLQAIHSSLGKCKSALNNIKEIVSTFQLIEEDEDLQSEIDSVNEIIKVVNDQRTKVSEKQPSKKREKHVQKEEEGLPPEDFRILSILPAVRDVQMDEKPFLRANRAEGKYENLDTYLDIQFRLLREDFMQPLRAGITEYIQRLKQNKTEFKSRDIRVYKNVQIVRPVCTHDGINHVIQFDVSAFKRVKWQASRRLLYGSLLCLSCDNFQTIYYATVKDRNAKDLNEGILRVFFEQVPEENISETFLMAESSSYFEAFRHILTGLRSTDSSLPFQRYIVECQTEIKPPGYLLTGQVSTYNFKSILPNKKRTEYAEVPVLTTTRWPTETDLGLDTTQWEALKLAITKELAIIQGPPGTGKTFIGLKIAKLLIHNSLHWKPSSGKGCPILIVCYTNHALDQFLEGVLAFFNENGGIVRVGGRCQSEKLEPYILRNLKQSRKKEKKRTFGILQLEKDCLSNLHHNQEDIQRTSSELKKTFNEIIPFEKLKTQMTPDHEDSFERNMKNELKKNYMTIWLGFRPEELDSSRDSEKPKAVIATEIWISHIVENIDAITTAERRLDTDLTTIPLYDRARLYKAWLAELLNELQRFIEAEDHPLRKEALHLQKSSEKALIKPQQIFKLTSSSSLKSEISKVMSKIDFATWLAIDGSINSMNEIQSAITSENSGDKQTPNDDNDIEEDRELDSDADDDDILMGYDEDDDFGRHPTAGKAKGMKEGDWILQWNAKKERTQVRKLLSNAQTLTDDQATRITNIFSNNKTQRHALYKYWVMKYRDCLRLSIKETEKEFNASVDHLREVREAETFEILQAAHVIGMTTTGAAKHREALQKVKPSIVIVEEAAEVLESHIITALSDGCKHLILIGDHKQLRPSTTVYELAKHYKLDISLFERMIRNGLPCVTLLEQHRMRPEISILLKNQNLYPKLKDHTSVRAYDKVRGIDQDVFFIDHDHCEIRSEDSTSYHNPHEASYLAGLCKYLLLQGYERSQITVLSPYMGQVSLLRKAMPKKEFEGVRITAVDNYQGEENDIILLSLVRSRDNDVMNFFNKKNPIGFLGIENRICVAMSRAKMGFYVIGNFTLLENHSGLWQIMVKEMRQKERIGKDMTLRCENHPKNVIKASVKDDFEKAPEGGCKEPCGGKLNCNHICPRVCHIIDKTHEQMKCLKPCEKVFIECNHTCVKKCYQECGKCETKVIKKVPMCNHTARMPCHMDPFTWKCFGKCDANLPCGHKCQRVCHECVVTHRHETMCKAPVARELPCGHSIELNCYQNPADVICPEKCTAVLMCGHECTGSCGSCFRGKIHKLCEQTCRKVMPCGHKCSSKCSDLCPPCSLPCEWECSHFKKCSKRCSEECDKCVEDCGFSCPHSKCSKLCHEMCDKTTCSEKCSRKRLDCDHPCIGLCSESCICSEFCPKKENKYSSTYEEGTPYIKVKKCKCVVPQILLDSHVRSFTSTRKDAVLRCPNCKRPMSSLNKRYSNELKERRLEVIEKYKKIRGSEREKNDKTNATVS